MTTLGKPLLVPDRMWPLMPDMKRFFDDDATSDITIKYGKRELKVHWLMLSSESTYFRRLCGPPRLPGSDRLIIELVDDNEEAVTNMFRWMYGFDYPTTAALPSGLQTWCQYTTYNFARHVANYEVAKKYQLPVLGNLAKESVTRILTCGCPRDFTNIHRQIVSDGQERYPAFVRTLWQEQRRARTPPQLRALYANSWIGKGRCGARSGEDVHATAKTWSEGDSDGQPLC